MNPIVINGTVLCDNITGIPRYVYENVVRLDKLIEGTGLDVRIAYRDDGRPIHLPELKNIRLVPLKSVPYFYNLVVLPAYLRRTHAFYVEMCIRDSVGPRPEVPYHVEHFKEEIPRYLVRQQVRPGCTGWAQIHGLRGDTDIAERIRYDIW